MIMPINSNKISFVVPCYRSERTIESVYNEIVGVMKERTEYQYEVIAVNDCSPDDVGTVLRKIAQRDASFKVVELVKNVGKHSALMAGFRFCSGRYVVCMDDDGQCPADHLWELIAPLENGADVAMAKYGRKKQSRFKNFGSIANAWMMRNLLNKPKDFQFANFAAMQHFIIEEIIRYTNPYTYVNGLLLRTTARMVNVPMEERARLSGSSGYRFRNSLKLWIDGFTAFSVKPLRLISLISCFYLCIGFMVMLLGGVQLCFRPGTVRIEEAAALFIPLGLGFIMLSLGLLGEYIGRLYICINKEPQYVIRNTYNLDRDNDGK